MEREVTTNQSLGWRARIADYLSLERNVTIASAAIFLLGIGEELWKKFLPKYLEALGASVRWEESRGGALFPHIYGAPITLDVVLAYGPLEREADGSIKLPITG